MSRKGTLKGKCSKPYHWCIVFVVQRSQKQLERRSKSGTDSFPCDQRNCIASLLHQRQGIGSVGQYY